MFIYILHTLCLVLTFLFSGISLDVYKVSRVMGRLHLMSTYRYPVETTPVHTGPGHNVTKFINIGNQIMYVNSYLNLLFSEIYLKFP